MELNNITNTGTWGQQVTRLNDNFNKVALGIDTLQEMYKSLSQSSIEVVDTLPQAGEANKIYRLVGTTSYSDYMYNADDLNTPILMATYNNGIDDVPTTGSNNLVKSGGVYQAINTNTENVEECDFAISDENGNLIACFSDGHIRTEKFNSAQANNTNTENVEECDFAISDENGNLIACFSDGHIRTEKFNSKDNNTLRKFKGKKIGLIADSITTYNGWLPSDISGYSGKKYATYYPSGNVDNVSKTWWYKMAKMLGLEPSTDISNCAWSGSRVSGDSSSTSSAAAGCSTRRITDLSARGFIPDIIICFISCNDWGNSPNVPIGTWEVTSPVPNEGIQTTLREAYALMLYKIHLTYPNARVFCCTNMDDKARDKVDGWPPNNNDGVSVYEWNKNIIEIAEAFGCDIINTHDCGINYANISNFVVDAGLHPNAEGMEMLAQKVVAELIAKY